MVSRRLLEQLGPFDEQLVMCEDDELWLRLAEHSEVDGIDANARDCRVRSVGGH